MDTLQHIDEMADVMGQLLEQAQQMYQQHFPATVCFERAVFFSWGCTIGDCTFCYMSTQPADKKPQETKRSLASLYAEFLLTKHLGWDIGFFTGGIGAFTPQEIEQMLQVIYQITGQKIWLSIGPVPKVFLQKYQPYIKGVVGSTETINPVLHKKVCPSKPLAPYERMFEAAKELNLQRAMTFIVGMGETKEDLQLLKDFITKYEISKIHIYGLIPTKGTMFEHTQPPTKEEQAWWIAQLRIAFPTLDIQCGIWEDRVEYIPMLLQAGSNSISKFKATKLFGTAIAQGIEEKCQEAGRIFKGTLTKIPEVDWKKEVEKLPLEGNVKTEVSHKLELYLKKMEMNVQAQKNKSKKKESYIANLGKTVVMTER